VQFFHTGVFTSFFESIELNFSSLG